MSPTPQTLDASFKARALPAGSARFWSHAFAAPELRPALLGVYALGAEWNALIDPSTEASVAQIKLAWWQEEMLRLVTGRPVHPISLFLASLPHATPEAFEPLMASLEAAILEAGGVPLERAADLNAQATALLAHPLRVASRLSGYDADDSECTSMLAVAEYLSRALKERVRAARHGRVLFPVEELLAAGIDNTALTASSPEAALINYLATWRARAQRAYAGALEALPTSRGLRHRHLAVLAALGAEHLRRDSTARPRALKDMLLAWGAARRAGS